MSKWMANSVFLVGGREYVPGESVPDDLPGGALLAEQGFIVPRDGKKAAWTENAPPKEMPLPDEEETEETPLPDEEEAAKKPPRGRKAGTEK